MNTKKLENENWRYYFFEEEKQKFCFDCFTYKIFSFNSELYDYLKKKNYKAIKKQYPIFYKKVITQKEMIDKSSIYFKKCNVTINISNKCNLDCIYCYRDKSEKSFLTENDLDEIFKYIINDYMPEADCYSLSFCNTSESTLDLNKLIYIDSLIAKYEGYLFSKKNSNEKQLWELYKRLPKSIKDKYPFENGLITLNGILQNEELWKIYDFSNNDYLTSVITGKDKLSLSRRVMANRQILNKTFLDLKLEKTIKYISMWFMTNGTNITDEYITFLKSIFMNEITVSIDGKEEIHNYSRKYANGSGSFADTLKGIKKLKENGIEVIASITITPANPDFLETLDYLLSIGIKKVSFNLVRGIKDNTSFSEEAIIKLISNWSKIYEIVYKEIETDNYKYVLILKDSYPFSIIQGLYFRKYRTMRCGWGTELVIDSQGNMYHCNSTIGYKEDYLGNYKDRIRYRKIKSISRNVNTDLRCKKCYAKYLCGGTCYANDILKNTNGRNQECKYKSELIRISLKFYAKLHKNGLLKKFMEVVSC